MTPSTLPEELRKELAKHYHSFILITCTEPSSEGKMDVSLIYECEESLAAYLLETAQCTFEPEKSSHERVD